MKAVEFIYTHSMRISLDVDSLLHTEIHSRIDVYIGMRNFINSRLIWILWFCAHRKNFLLNDGERSYTITVAARMYTTTHTYTI